MIDLASNAPAADAVRQAQRAIAQGLYLDAASYYETALARVPDDAASAELRRALWLEHVGVLLNNELLKDAERAGHTYICRAQQLRDRRGELELTALVAESFAAQDDWDSCRKALARFDLLLLSDLLDAEPIDHAFPAVTRLRGLLAVHDGQMERASLLLASAREGFAALHNDRGTAAIDKDVRRLALQSGSGHRYSIAAGEVITTSDLLLDALALRRDGRFEAAARLLEGRLARDVDPSLRFPLLHELILLHRILGARETGVRLFPLLLEAADMAGNPAQARAIAQRLALWLGSRTELTADMSFEGLLHNVRVLIGQNKLDEAEDALRRLREMAKSPRFAAYWTLAAGELEFALGIQSASPQGNVQQAIGQLNRAVDLAHKASLPDVYSAALRLLGRAYALLADDWSTATDYWARAARSDERIARRQESDQTRIRYLESTATEFDEMVSVAASRVRSNGPVYSASLIAAIETARGAAILPLIASRISNDLREVPAPSNVVACLAWCRKMSSYLQADQAVLLMHATPEAVHYGLFGRGVVQSSSLKVNRPELFKAIGDLTECWTSSTVLETVVQKTPSLMQDRLAGVMKQLRLEQILGRLPAHVRRLVIVAGDALGEVPFSALPMAAPGGGTVPLIARFALSDMPCASAYLPLQERSRSNRGDGGLIVHPPASNLAFFQRPSRFKVLEGTGATVNGLEEVLKTGNYAQLRIDSHGSLAAQAENSWLELAPAGDDDGRLTAKRFSSFPLGTCGTLILGACESGMYQRIGRDERVGFVRAGFSAGTSAVVAARWIASDVAAEAILTAFQHRLRFCPRDVALQRAQLQFILDPGRFAQMGLPDPSHPARWACWSLYGDSGFQTNAAWPIRMIRKRMG